MPKIIVTGGCGYIGSHTVVDLAENGFEVISIDSHVRSDAAILLSMGQILHQDILNHAIDLRDKSAVLSVFRQHQDAIGVIHFAAFKSVPESVGQPLKYHDNNLNSLLNVLDAMQTVGIPNLIFSSSCSVYGNAQELPVRETTPLGTAESPYAYTKQVGEQMCRQAVAAFPKLQAIMLRYFNPAGAHPSIGIGEIPQAGAYNVVPLIMESLLGLRSTFTVLGNDYATKDGSCVRDYIHVSDVAHAHTKAIEYLLQKRNADAYEVFNVGIGDGVSVLELLGAFERANGIKVPYVVGERRAGDVESIYANPDKARLLLGWSPRYSLEDMMRTAWLWQCKRVGRG